MKFSWGTIVILATSVAVHARRLPTVDESKARVCEQGYKYSGANLIKAGWDPVDLQHWAQTFGVGGGDIKKYLFFCMGARVPEFLHYCKYGAGDGGEEYDDFCFLEPEDKPSESSTEKSIRIQL